MNQEKDGEYIVLCKLIATGGSMEACPALAYDLTRMLTESYHCLEVMAAWSHTRLRSLKVLLAESAESFSSSFINAQIS